MSVITVTLQGTRPMLQHNGRLANPIDPMTREVKALADKRKKTVDDYQRLLALEAYAGCWVTEGGELGLPTDNVWASIYEAAKMSKRGKDVKRALAFDPLEVCAFLIGGTSRDAREHVEQTSGAGLFIRTVVVNQRRCLRARPLVSSGWVTTHTFTLLDDVMDVDALEPIIHTAGRLIGVGDWRPIYGRFDVTAMMVDADAKAA